MIDSTLKEAVGARSTLQAKKNTLLAYVDAAKLVAGPPPATKLDAAAADESEDKSKGKGKDEKDKGKGNSKGKGKDEGNGNDKNPRVGFGFISFEEVGADKAKAGKGAEGGGESGKEAEGTRQ